MKMLLCDAAGCTAALPYENEYETRAEGVRWTMTHTMVEVGSKAPAAPVEPDFIHGEVTIRGERLPFVLHRPKEFTEAAEAALRAYGRTPDIRRVTITLCPACSPSVPALKKGVLPEVDARVDDGVVLDAGAVR